MEINTDTLIQGGAVSISLALIWLVARLVKDFKDVITNHISHATEVERQQTKWLQKLVDVIEALDRRLNGKR